MIKQTLFFFYYWLWFFDSFIKINAYLLEKNSEKQRENWNNNEQDPRVASLRLFTTIVYIVFGYVTYFNQQGVPKTF